MASQKISKNNKPASKPSASKTSTSSKAAAKSEAESAVVANAELVSLIRDFDSKKEEVKSAYVEMGKFAQENQLTKAEVIASIVEARGCEKKTAEQQYSRYKALFTDPDALAKLEEGDVDLKQWKAKNTKKQQNPSSKKAQENATKNFASGLSKLINAAKVLGTDRDTILQTVKAACKKGGII